MAKLFEDGEQTMVKAFSPPTTIAKKNKGLTLIELLVAMAILAVLLLGIGISMLRMEHANMLDHDRALAHKAAQQILEIIMNESLSDALSRHGTTFSVFGMTTCPEDNTGSISVQDMGWDSSSGQSYLFTITVAHPDGSRVYAQLFAVRTAQT